MILSIIGYFEQFHNAITANDMGSFCSVMTAILFCTSIWDKPNKKLFELWEMGDAIYNAKYLKRLEQDKQTALAVEIAGSKETSRRLFTQLIVLNKNIYIPFAFILGIFSILELYLGLSIKIGFYNWILLLPIITYIIIVIFTIFISFIYNNYLKLKLYFIYKIIKKYQSDPTQGFE